LCDFLDFSFSLEAPSGLGWDVKKTSQAEILGFLVCTGSLLDNPFFALVWIGDCER